MSINLKQKLAKYMRQYYQNNKEKLLEQSKQWNQDHKEQRKQRYQDNKEELSERSRKYYWSHKKERAIYKQSRKKEAAKYIRQYMVKKYKENPKFRLNQIIGSGIRKSLKGKKNGRYWESLVSFTLVELMAHLELLFDKGMTWEDRGKWHLDHIKPISLFNFKNTDDPEFKECWSLSNLQPLWAKDNLDKSNKYKED